MKHCISCEAEIADNAMTCPKCGHVMEGARKGKTWANIVCVFALIFGILSAGMGGLCWIPVLGLAIAVPALVLAIVGLAGSIVCCVFSSKRGVCVTGIVFSAIGLIPSLIRVIMLVAYAGVAATNPGASSAFVF